VDSDGLASVVDHWISSAAREFYAGVYLNSVERARWENCAPRERRGWLLRRIAIKDAVRVRIAERGVTGVYPAEILVADDESAVSGLHCESALHFESALHGRVLAGLAVRAAQVGEIAVALAGWDDERPSESRLRSELATAIRRNR
jgi:hypothetical protein